MKLYLLNAGGLLFSICLFFAFTPFRPVKQGLEGYVYMVSGNRMPSVGVGRPAPRGIKTTLYIFELTNINQVFRQQESPFYSSVQTKLVKRLTSDSKGYFSVQLPPGRYSVFAKKDSLYFANQYDEKNNIFPVQVQRGKMAKVKFTIDYDAAY